MFLSPDDFVRVAALCAGHGELTDGMVTAYLCAVGEPSRERVCRALALWMRGNNTFPSPCDLGKAIKSLPSDAVPAPAVQQPEGAAP